MIDKLTFRLLPGRPRMIFFSSATFFLGGILLKAGVVVWKERGGDELWVRPKLKLFGRTRSARGA